MEGRGWTINKILCIHRIYIIVFFFPIEIRSSYNLQDRIRWNVFPGEKKMKGKYLSVEDINIRVGLSTLSLYNAALLVHGFNSKLGFFADFLYISLIAQSPVLRSNEQKRRVRAARPKQFVFI